MPPAANPTDLPSDTTPSAGNESREGVRGLTPPQGWTNDPVLMHLDYYWRGQDEDLKESLETDYKLSDARPLLTREPKSGDVMFLLQSKQKEDSGTEYYVWNDIESELCKIKSPTSLKDIYKSIHEKEGYLQDLELEVVNAETDEEED